MGKMIAGLLHLLLALAQMFFIEFTFADVAHNARKAAHAGDDYFGDGQFDQHRAAISVSCL